MNAATSRYPFLKPSSVATGVVLVATLAAAGAGGAATGPPDASAPPAAWPAETTTIQQEITDSEYHLSWQTETQLPGRRPAWHATNRKQGFRTYFGEDEIRVVPRDAADEPLWSWGLTLVGYGRGGAVSPVERPILLPREARIDYERGAVKEWYVNERRGLEQGFTLASPPAERPDAPGPVALAMSLGGTLVPHLAADGLAIDFTAPAGGLNVLHFSQLQVLDAGGRELASWFELFVGVDGPGVRIVFDDADAVYPVTVDPLLTTAAWTGQGDQAGAEFGYSVSGAGDVNGDGFDDVIVGAPHFDNGQMDEGRAYVYLGSASGLAATPHWIMEPNAAGVLFGSSVASAGDVDGDGYGDVIVGSPHYSLGQFHEGAAWVYHGSSSGPSTTADWYAEGGVAEALFGHSVASAGDVNYDGWDDVVIGAPEYGGGAQDEGAAYVFHGSAGGLEASASWMRTGGQAGALFGYSVASAGDVDGDDHDDVIVGAPMYDNSETDEGMAFVYHGSPSGLGASPIWTAERDQADARFGHAVSSAGDVNGDGFDDVIVGAPLYDANYADTGRAWIFHGSAVGLGPAYFPHLQGFVDQKGSQLGITVASAGDVNGDGFDDVVAGTPLFDEGALPSVGGTADDGRAYVVLGSATGMQLGQHWGSWSTQHGGRVGCSVAGAGDVNGDGFDDVIAGADRYEDGLSDEGHAFLFHGNRQVVTAWDLVRALGFDDADISGAYWWTALPGGQPPADASSDSVSYGPIPGSVLITSGRAADGGLGSTDWGSDGQPENTRFTMSLRVPAGAEVLRFTTQFISAEFDAGNPGRDEVSLTYQYYTGSGNYQEVDLDAAIEGLAWAAVNPPMSHAVSVQGKTYIGIHIYVNDEVDGANDSALLLSRVFFSEVPLPDYIAGPDIDSDGIVDYYRDTEPQDVSLTSGTYTFAQELISVPGKSMPFALGLVYNSGSTLRGAVGEKWSHSYESYAYKLEDADTDTFPDNILARHGSGSADYFEQSDGSGGYQPKYPGNYNSLTLEVDGTLTLVTKDHLTYSFTLPVPADPPEDPSKLYLLEQVTDSNGNAITIHYDEFYRIDYIVDTRGEQFDFDFGEDGLLDAVTYAAASAEVRFGYDDEGRLLWFSDLNGYRTSFTYDARGLLLTGTDAEGNVFVSNGYESFQGLGLDQVGRRVKGKRDAKDRNPSDPQAGLSIDYTGESVVSTDRLGREQTVAHDVKGRPAQRIDALGGEWKTTYDAANNKVAVENPQGTVTAMEYDAFGNRTLKTEASATCVGGANQGIACAVDVDCPASSCGSQTAMTYDGRHNLETSTDHLGFTKVFSYYPGTSNLEREEDPAVCQDGGNDGGPCAGDPDCPDGTCVPGHAVTHTYNGAGQPETMMPRRGNDPADPVAFGLDYVYAYSALGYLESRTDPLGKETSYTYDKLGHNLTVTDPRLHTTTYTYDDMGHVTSDTNELGQTATFTYDRLGRMVSSRERGGATWDFSYTATGKPASIVDPLGYSTDHQYDAEDRLTAQTDPLGRIRSFEYDDLDRLTRVVDRDGLTEASATYDAIGGRTSITDPNGNKTTYGYDLLGRLTRETDPRCNIPTPDPRCAAGLLSIDTTYDGRGLTTSRTNQRGQTVTYGYDAVGRLTQVGLFGGDTTVHVLDADGNRTSSASTRFHDVDRTFDALNRPTQRTDGFGNSVGYQYDAAGNVEFLTYSDGKTVTYVYDELNRLIRVEDWNLPPRVTTYTYSLAGDLETATLPDGSTVTYTWDAAHQSVGISDVGTTAGTIFAASYTLNTAGERVAADLTLPLDPILTESDESFSHNAANELDGPEFSYDEDGNMTAGVIGGTPRTMTYDERNQMTQLDGDTFFEYDVDGLRVWASRGGGTRRYVFDPTGKHLRLLEEHDDAGNIVARYVYGAGLISREDAAGNAWVYHFDSRGSTVALTDAASGAITDRYAYSPYGQVVRRQGATENPFTFNGRDGVFDESGGQVDASALYFMRTRFYSPALMRFVQKDQVFEGFLQVPQSLNRHAYVMGNPIQFVDPNGDLDWEQVMWLALGALGLYAASVVAAGLAVMLGVASVPFVVGVLIVVASVAAIWAVMHFAFGVEVDWSKLSYFAPVGWITNFVKDVFEYDVVAAGVSFVGAVASGIASGAVWFYESCNLAAPLSFVVDIEVTPQDFVEGAVAVGEAVAEGAEAVWNFITGW